VPELVAAPDKGAWPRVLKTSAEVTAVDKPVRHHRIKKALAGKRRRATVASAPASGFASFGDWRRQQF